MCQPRQQPRASRLRRFVKAVKQPNTYLKQTIFAFGKPPLTSTDFASKRNKTDGKRLFPQDTGRSSNTHYNADDPQIYRRFRDVLQCIADRSDVSSIYYQSSLHSKQKWSPYNRRSCPLVSLCMVVEVTESNQNKHAV